MDIYLIFVLLLSTVIFFLVSIDNSWVSRSYPGGDCFDGNGKYQYKGRGYKKESVDILLDRIDWLAKNNINNPVYPKSYIISYVLSIGVLIILYSSSCYIVSVWDYVLILLASFIIVFSVINLMSFHTDRYPSYYIRKNIKYIKKKLRLDLGCNPPLPHKKSYVPHRTIVRDELSY